MTTLALLKKALQKTLDRSDGQPLQIKKGAVV